MQILYNFAFFINTRLCVSVKMSATGVMSAKEKLVTVCTARQMEAHIIKGRLESEGIPSLLSYESAGLVYGLTIDGLGEVKIMVLEHLADAAREILGIGKSDKSESEE